MSLYSPPHPPISRESSVRSFNLLLKVLTTQAEGSNSSAEDFSRALKFTLKVCLTKMKLYRSLKL